MAKKANTQKTRKATTKASGKLPEATALRNALPFIKLGSTAEGGGVNYWNVCPSGQYTEDLERGRKYARAFLPMMAYNAGASDLACIVSAMALAARDLSSRPQGHLAVPRWRGIDNVAMGFMMEIGGMLQAMMGGAIVAAGAIKHGRTEQAAQFADAVERGELFKGLQRSTLSHDPTATIFDKSSRH
jgi:hypothetical protein